MAKRSPPWPTQQAHDTEPEAAGAASAKVQVTRHWCLLVDRLSGSGQPRPACICKYLQESRAELQKLLCRDMYSRLALYGWAAQLSCIAVQWSSLGTLDQTSAVAHTAIWWWPLIQRWSLT